MRWDAAPIALPSLTQDGRIQCRQILRENRWPSRAPLSLRSHVAQSGGCCRATGMHQRLLANRAQGGLRAALAPSHHGIHSRLSLRSRQRRTAPSSCRQAGVQSFCENAHRARARRFWWLPADEAVSRPGDVFGAQGVTLAFVEHASAAAPCRSSGIRRSRRETRAAIGLQDLPRRPRRFAPLNAPAR